jgi:hypothetical protein
MNDQMDVIIKINQITTHKVKMLHLNFQVMYQRIVRVRLEIQLTNLLDH